MRKVLAVFLVVVMVAQTCINIGIGLYYHLNKTYITQKLCENKRNPNVHCNGHCYLSKQLKKAEEGENKSEKLFREKEEIISYEITSLSLKFSPDFTITEIRLQNYNLYSTDDYNSILKPPTA